jgi:hypothetical protein
VYGIGPPQVADISSHRLRRYWCQTHVLRTSVRSTTTEPTKFNLPARYSSKRGIFLRIRSRGLDMLPADFSLWRRSCKEKARYNSTIRYFTFLSLCKRKNYSIVSSREGPEEISNVFLKERRHRSSMWDENTCKIRAAKCFHDFIISRTTLK